MFPRLRMLKPSKNCGNTGFRGMPTGLYFRNGIGMPGGGLGRGRVVRGEGVGGGISDVNPKSTHAKTMGIYSIFHF